MSPAAVVVPVAGMITFLSMVLGLPLVRAFVKRMESGQRHPQLGGDVVARLDRIEQAIEAMATEVERIAEGQRFTTRLLASDTSELAGQKLREQIGTPAATSPTAAGEPGHRLASDRLAGERPAIDPSNPGTVLTPAARRS